MNEEDYKNWLNRIGRLMIEDGESQEFINYLVQWFNSIQGSVEMELLQKYHPGMKNKSEDEIYEFMRQARFFVEGMSKKEFQLQIFDSAFFLYRTLLRTEFKEILETENSP